MKENGTIESSEGSVSHPNFLNK